MIFITGDKHGTGFKAFSNRRFPTNKIMTKDDFIIVTGDFGLIWEGSNEEKYWLNWLEQRNFTTLFVDGNHENFTLLNGYPVEEWNGGKVRRINSSVLHLTRGQVFNLQGLKIFTFGGAASHDLKYRTELKDWWRDEMPSQVEYDEGFNNLDRVGWKVDYVVTHCAPAALQPMIVKESKSEDIHEDELNRYLQKVYNRLEFRKWYAGHYHIDKAFDEGRLEILYESVVQIG